MGERGKEGDVSVGSSGGGGGGDSGGGSDKAMQELNQRLIKARSVGQVKPSKA